MYLLERVFRTDFRKFFLLVLLISLPFALSAQKKLTVNFDNIPIGQAFKEIEKESGYSFAYNKTKYSLNKTIRLSMTDATLDDVLKNVLKGTGYSYSVSNNRIFLSMATEKSPQAVTVISLKEAPVVTELKETPADSVASVPHHERAWQQPALENTDRYLPIPQKNLNDLFNVKYPDWTTPVIQSPVLAVKTNLLYALTSTFNLGAEVRLSDRYTLDLSVNYNPWTFGDNKKIKHLMFQPELRYWLCEAFDGHFFGFHAQYARFNAGGVGFSDYMKDHRFQGNLFGAGFSYGYEWYLSPRWSMEATIGFGYNFMDYKTYECKDCGKYQGSNTKHYFGPTKAGVSLIYMIK